MNRSKQINLAMPDPLLGRLETEAARVGVPMQPLIRVLIDEALHMREMQRLHAVGMRRSVLAED